MEYGGVEHYRFALINFHREEFPFFAGKPIIFHFSQSKFFFKDETDYFKLLYIMTIDNASITDAFCYSTTYKRNSFQLISDVGKWKIFYKNLSMTHHTTQKHTDLFDDKITCLDIYTTHSAHRATATMPAVEAEEAMCK